MSAAHDGEVLDGTLLPIVEGLVDQGDIGIQETIGYAGENEGHHGADCHNEALGFTHAGVEAGIFEFQDH